jgi:hypothetical protein
MTELRQKMIRAMELKNLSPHTQRAYLAAVTGLARHYRQSPVGITKEMIEDYLLLLKKSRASNSCGLVLTGLLFCITANLLNSNKNSKFIILLLLEVPGLGQKQCHKHGYQTIH